jgi:hypothetical protein
MLAEQRPDPNNPGNLLPGVVPVGFIQQAEEAAAALSGVFTAFNRGQILETISDMVTQFKNPEDSLAILPDILRAQMFQVLQGETREQARGGAMALVRAMGLSSRLINNNGRIALVDENDPNSQFQATEFIETYMRARMIGGRDINPDQVFQVMKYMKWPSARHERDPDVVHRDAGYPRLHVRQSAAHVDLKAEWPSDSGGSAGLGSRRAWHDHG